MVSLRRRRCVFLAAGRCWPRSGWSRSDWQARGRRAERAADLRRPGAGDAERGRRSRRPSGPNVDISATSTRWRRATRSGTSAPPSSRPTETREGRRRCRSAPTGSAATCSPRRSRARRSRSSSACSAALLATLIGTVLGALGRLLRRQGRRLARVALQRLHRDPRHPADLRVRGGVVGPRHRHRSVHHPRRWPAGPASTGWCAPSSSSTRCASTCAPPRRSAPAPCRACSATSCPTSATWCWCSCRMLRGRLHQGRGDPVVPRAWASASTRSAGARCWPRRRAS